jgi:prepilin-type N-terminal cleavage/methylation domain-containing protein
MNKKRPQNGFTLLEILLVVAIFTILASLVFPLTIKDSQGAKLLATAKQMESVMFRYQQSALSRLNNTNYGIAFFLNKYTLFEGNTLASATFTEDIEIPARQSISSITLTGGGTEILFTQGSFRPNKSGNIKITDSILTYTVDINSEGLIRAYK